MQIDDIVTTGPVIPVIVLHRLEHAVPLARALVGGGVRVLEVTLRTAVGLDAIRAIKAEVPTAIVGAGTITTPAELQRAIDAGAMFGVCPGASPTLLKEIAASGLPFLPGTMTPSEVVAAREAGFRVLKLFPAKEAGGESMLKALGSVFQDVRFCPTGGIDAVTAPQYLALPNVVCVGGSWLAPKALLDAENWAEIGRLAHEAVGLRAAI